MEQMSRVERRMGFFVMLPSLWRPCMPGPLGPPSVYGHNDTFDKVVQRMR